jgi:hypothetical protein
MEIGAKLSQQMAREDEVIESKRPDVWRHNAQFAASEGHERPVTVASI